jgi:hypothetical protein
VHDFRFDWVDIGGEVVYEVVFGYPEEAFLVYDGVGECGRRRSFTH